MLKNSLQKVSNSINTFSKSMKVNKDSFNVKYILQNRMALYLFLFISLLHLFYYVNIGDYQSVAIFILVGFLTTFFNKNMLIILITALIVTHIIRFGLRKAYEGIENIVKEEEKEEKEEGFTDETKVLKEEEEEEKEGMKEGKDKGAVPPKGKDSAKPSDAKDLDSDKKKDYLEFQSLQSEIMKNMEKLEPLITQAESFVEKYQEKYGK